MNVPHLLLVFACGQGGPPDGHVPVVLVGSDTGTTGTTGTTTPPQGTVGLSGEAIVMQAEGEWTYLGSETAWFQAPDGSTSCQVDSEVAQMEMVVPPCETCEWSLSLRSSGSTAQGCAGLDVRLYDGQRFAYGYLQGEEYGQLAVYYQDYGWYGVEATASFDPSTGSFEYEWPIGTFNY